MKSRHLRYARTSAEAFKDASYACALEKPRRNPDAIVVPSCILAALALLAFALAGWLN